MRGYINLLSDILVCLGALILLLSAVSLFSPSASNFFELVFDKVLTVARDFLEDIKDFVPSLQ